MSLYTEERQQDIVNKFRALIMEADNFPREKNPDDYRMFWTGLRGDGASMLGLTLHLIESLTNAKSKIDQLSVGYLVEQQKSDKENDVPSK
tara:strand:+ start:824 stop:1096 length:273 start_codon:yes stop_codon:yes gene_type:complete